MFDSLSDKLQNVMKKLKGQTRISEKELKEMLQKEYEKRKRLYK